MHYKVHAEVDVEDEEEMELKGTSKNDKSDDDMQELCALGAFHLSPVRLRFHMG